MPMFPLGAVLLPGSMMPLHVFEPRYRQMIIDCLDQDGEPEFGQTLITHGQETGGGDQRAMVGTVAKMVEVEAIDASRYALIAVGARRIKVEEWLTDDPYPVADVVDWLDEKPNLAGLAERIAAMSDRVRICRELAARLGTPGGDSSRVTISEDPVVATYNLAAIAPVGPADRLRLLSSPGPSTRLDLLEEILDDVEAMLKFRLS
ncbi:MAG: LON peptidase substrate-binding domain-containing protein [Actinobacteria bacterium]|nr:LON peptidase substrate-binding domain-containing protein [Actinomycetota bacterium]